MALPLRWVATRIFISRRMFRTHYAVGKQPVYFTSAIQNRLIIKSIRCRFQKS